MIIPTEHKPCEIELIVNGSENDILKAFDSRKPNTNYYYRSLNNGRQKYIIKLPISPDILTIELEGENCVIENFLVKKLEIKKLKVNTNTKKFIAFAKRFVEKAGYLKPGLYTDYDKLFVIDYQYFLEDRGYEAGTPARIGVTNNVIQISKSKFKQMSIPDRFLILMHEYSHNYLNQDPDNEEEADKWAELIYFSIGFPVFNGVDILYRVLGDDKLSEARIKQVYNNAKDFAEEREFSNSII